MDGFICSYKIVGQREQYGGNRHERYGYQSRLYWRQIRKWRILQNAIEQDGR